MSRRQVRALLVLGLLLVMINLPAVLSVVTERRIRADGVTVIAPVVGTEVTGSGSDQRYLLTLQLPPDVSPQQLVLGAEVTQEVFEAAEQRGTVQVRLLENRPTAYRVEGQITSRAGLWFTLVADLALALLVVILVRSGRYRRPGALVLEATGDVEPDPTGTPGIFETGGDELVVRGWVGEVSEDDVLLDLRDRHVLVVLDGFANPVAPGELAMARGRPLE